MNKYRFSTKLLLAFFCLLLLNFSVSAQRRGTRKSPAKKPAAAAPASNISVRQGADKVAVQIKNLSKFIYNLGGVARVIEDLDKEIAAGRGSRNARDLNSKNKAAVLTTIGNLRAGLVALEVEFRSKPELRPYNAPLLGIADLTAQAEDAAAAGQITNSGNILLEIIEKLTDTLAAMP